MKPRNQANVWNLKSFRPYFEEVKFGRKRFDVRRTKSEFPIIKGDWIIFALYHSKYNTFSREYDVKAIDYVLNTGEAPFWKDQHKDGFLGFTVMQLVDPTCPKCDHKVTMIYDRDGDSEMGYHDASYFQCVATEKCECFCDEFLMVDSGLTFVGEDGLINVE